MATTTTSTTTPPTTIYEGSISLPLASMTSRFFGSPRRKLASPPSMPALTGKTVTNSSTVGKTEVASSTSDTTLVGNGGAAQTRIKELEMQVRALNEKAAAAADRVADYEDEVRSLRSQLEKQPPSQSDERHSTCTTSTVLTANTDASSVGARSSTSSTASIPHSKDETSNPSPAPAPAPQTGRLSNFTSLLSLRRSHRDLNAATSSSVPATTNLPSTSQPTTPTSTPSVAALQTALSQERHLRESAESQLQQTQSELEDLTATLFGQANEMVAEERKAKAKLEERVKTLEAREKGRRERLERLERAIERVGRVRELVG